MNFRVMHYFEDRDKDKMVSEHETYEEANKKKEELNEYISSYEFYYVDVVRCGWCTNEQIYMDYHDKEWGVPCYDKQKLFEMINLEGQQAGLSWITILKRRESYRKAFDNFDPYVIATYDEEKIQELLQDPGIIRYRLKIESIIKNAKAYIKMEQNGEDFSEFIWSFVNGTPVLNHPKDLSEVPAKTELSDKLSKELKKRGFSFVGSTICYAYMQAVGLVNDHVVTCHCHQEK